MEYEVKGERRDTEEDRNFKMPVTAEDKNGVRDQVEEMDGEFFIKEINEKSR